MSRVRTACRGLESCLGFRASGFVPVTVDSMFLNALYSRSFYIVVLTNAVEWHAYSQQRQA